jgi:hypothetical protein
VKAAKKPRKKVLTLFGTRPEIIRLAPVFQQLEMQPEVFQAFNVTTAQHTDFFIRLSDYLTYALTAICRSCNSVTVWAGTNQFRT